MNDLNVNKTVLKNDEIDIMDIVQQLWAGRKIIFIITTAFLILGGMYILYKKITIIPEYESRITVFVDAPSPEVLLAQITGTSFLTDVLKINLYDKGTNRNLTLEDILNKNTIPPQGNVAGLTNRVSLRSGQAGTYEIAVMMQDPGFAMQLADSVANKVTPFLSNFKTKRIQKNQEYITGRLIEADSAYLQSLNVLSDFYERNARNIRQMDTIVLKRLRAESELRFNVYSELAQEIEKMKIKEYELIPIINILGPATGASQSNVIKIGKPMIIMLLLGLLAGVGFIFGKRFLNNFTNSEN